MMLISDGKVLQDTLIRLSKKHESISLAVAWASAGTEAYKEIKRQRRKIKFMTIGTHFFQTDPRVLQDFVGVGEVRFILQPKGVFHPKVYLFTSRDSWEALIGSANFTIGALNKNTELMLHLSSDQSPDIGKQLKRLIKEYWKLGQVVTKEDVQNYSNLWNARQREVKRLGDDYGGTGKRAAIESRLMAMPWKRFLGLVKRDQNHNYRDRCKLLEDIHKAFKGKRYSEMDISDRYTIAGLPGGRPDETWGYFGSMFGAGYFKNAVRVNYRKLSKALDYIPLDGEVSRDSYMNYWRAFIKAFPDGGSGLGGGTRLLAMKRPDYFVCVNNKNIRLLCKEFGIKQAILKSERYYEVYWDEIVRRILDSVWWSEPEPTVGVSRRVWLGRAALLDSVFFDPN